MNDIMIDIETLGTSPDSVIVDIAAVQFDRATGRTGAQFHMGVSPDQKHRSICEQTLRWWFIQPAVVRSVAFSGCNPLRVVLIALGEFIGDENVWSQGSDFDFSILDHAYRQYGLGLPWKYWAKRDTRTVYDIYDFDPRNIEREGLSHDALSDCRHQIKCIVRALENRHF